jgi:hypothetical protein
MNRYQVGSPGHTDLFVHQASLKGICVGDDMILKPVNIGSNGDVNTEEYIEVSNEYYCVAGHQSSGRVVYAGEGNQAFSSNIDDLANSSVFCEYMGRVWDIALDHSGVRACLAGDDKNPVVFNFDLKKRLTFDAALPSALISCAWSPDSSTFAVVAKNGHLTLYTVDAEFTEIKQVHQWKITERDIKDDYLHGFNPRFVDEKTLIVAGKECLQIISKKTEGWHYSISSKIRHDGIIYQVGLLRDSFIATVGLDKKVCVWNLGIELKLKSFDISYKVLRIQFVPTQDLLVLIDDQGQVFTAQESIKAISGLPQPIVSEESDMDIESRKEAVPEDQSSMAVPTKIEHRMDEERRPEETKRPSYNEDSNYRFEEEPTKNPNPLTYRNRQLVYDEAEEADMRRNAGLIENLESRYARSNQKAARPRREDNAPQPAFIPGSTTGSGEGRVRRHFLCYNMYGKVLARQVSEKKGMVEAEFSDVNLSRQAFINDRGFNMAWINYRGILLASAGEIEREDEYADEEKDDAEKASTVRFVNADSKKTWDISFGRHENVQSIALGLYCIAVYTNKQLIRIFSPDGIEVYVFGFGRPVVGMCLYENVLAVVYHGTAPFSGGQMLRLQLINLASREVVEDRDLVLSAEARLRWFGFSEQGLFYYQDSKFVLWGQQSATLWAPVFDGAKEANMWVFGIDEQTIVYLKLPYGELEPSVLINYPPSNTSFRPPFVREEGRDRFLELLKLDQARLRSTYYGHMRASEIYDNTDSDPMTAARKTILGE